MVDNSAVKGTLVSFLVGITELSSDTSQIVDIKKIKSSPSYPDVIPKQMVVKAEKRTPSCHQVYVSVPVLNYTASYHSHRTGLRPFFTHIFSKTHLHTDLQLFKFTVQYAVFVEIDLPSVRCIEEAVALIRK